MEDKEKSIIFMALSNQILIYQSKLENHEYEDEIEKLLKNAARKKNTKKKPKYKLVRPRWTILSEKTKNSAHKFCHILFYLSEMLYTANS